MPTSPRPNITFIEQNVPITEYGRALYAVSRSVLRALLDSLTADDLTLINTPLELVSMSQLAMVLRMDRDKGMRGDGFEWAIHEAIIGREPKVIDPLGAAIRKACPKIADEIPTSLLFGYERARYLGFLDAVIEEAGDDAYLIPEGKGRPFPFGTWVSLAAQGIAAEPKLGSRIKKIWKTDLFLSAENQPRHLAATIKSNWNDLEGGAGLRIGVVPESTEVGNIPGVRFSNKHNLWVVTLADPDGFMGLFNDAYNAVGRAMCKLGKHTPPSYWAKPTAKGQKVQEQMEKMGGSRVMEVEDALNEAAQQDLVVVAERLVGVNAPPWLRIREMAPKLICPKPRFLAVD